jgi:hypothetical protein
VVDEVVTVEVVGTVEVVVTVVLLVVVTVDDVVAEVVVVGVVVEVTVDVVVVVVSHGHASAALPPTATTRHVSASVALVGKLPLGAHTHGACGSQVVVPTATCKTRRQSVAVGPAPEVIGWLQSPLAAGATIGCRSDMPASARAATADVCHPLAISSSATRPRGRSRPV